MAKENVKKFYDEISKNKELQEKFIAVQKGYETEGKSEEEIFEDILLPIAKEAGYEFTMSEYQEVQRDAMAEEGISEEELENVSGGWSGCLGIGVSSDLAICTFIGSDDKETSNIDGGGLLMCFFVGIGLGGTKNA